MNISIHNENETAYHPISNIVYKKKQIWSVCDL